ncbi:MAG: glycosyltransferase involved in cell wall biosynthesis [Marinoscillum sp.]|jgi:glycosyltransferase involved in cell wall biosynthesis
MSVQTSISVIVPVHNRVDFLAQALESVVNQGVMDMEIIVIDDSSLDSLSKVISKLCAKYDSVTLIKNDQNSGVSYSRNRGIERATGEFVVFLDSDDTLENNVLKPAVDFMTNHRDVDVLIGKTKLIDGTNSSRSFTRLEMRFEDLTNQHHHSLITSSEYFLLYQPAIHAMLFRTERLKNHRFDEGLVYGEDRLFCWELRSAGLKFQTSDNVMANYRISPTANQSSHAKQNFYQCAISCGLVKTSFEVSYLMLLWSFQEFASGKILSALSHFFRGIGDAKARFEFFQLVKSRLS